MRPPRTLGTTDELAALQAEGEENTEREPFTPEEAVRHRKRIEAVVTAQAKRRQQEHGGTAPGKANTGSNLEQVKESEHREQSMKPVREVLAKARAARREAAAA